MAATFVLLWLGTMALLTQWRCQRLEDDVYTAYRNARDELDEQLEYYQNNLNNGLGAEAAAILRNNLSSAALYLSYLDGGMALVVRDGAGAVIRSQLAWGYGHENGVDVGERWYLELDSGLDDTGQAALAEWMMAPTGKVQATPSILRTAPPVGMAPMPASPAGWRRGTPCG